MLIQQNIAQSFQSPIVRVLLGAIALGLLYVLWREVRKIPARLFTLMATAFVDMLGLLMIIPLLPFYVKTLGGSGVDVLGVHFGIGMIIGVIVAAFTIAQLVSAPMWAPRSSAQPSFRNAPASVAAWTPWPPRIPRVGAMKAMRSFMPPPGRARAARTTSRA